MKLRVAVLYTALALGGTLAGRVGVSWYDRRMPGPSFDPKRRHPLRDARPEIEFPDSEVKRIFEWRFDRLVEEGFDDLRATTLALRQDDSWRRAIEHVRRGADPVVAANIEL